MAAIPIPMAVSLWLPSRRSLPGWGCPAFMPPVPVEWFCQCNQSRVNKGATQKAAEQPHRMRGHKGSLWLEMSLQSPKIIGAELQHLRKCPCLGPGAPSAAAALSDPRRLLVWVLVIISASTQSNQKQIHGDTGLFLTTSLCVVFFHSE